MKKILCLALCLLCLAALFTGCKNAPAPTNSTETAAVPTLAESETAPSITSTVQAANGTVNFCGIDTMNVTIEQLAEAIGVDPKNVISTALGSGEELLIVNDVMFNTILYKQLQCINYADKTVITLSYQPNDETTHDALVGITKDLEETFGVPNEALQADDKEPTYTWHGADGDSCIMLYALTESDLKLSFYLY